MSKYLIGSSLAVLLLIAPALGAEDNTPNWMKTDQQKAQDAQKPQGNWGGYGGGQQGNQQQQGGQQGGGWQGGEERPQRPPHQTQSGPVYGTPSGGYQGGDIHIHVPVYPTVPRRPRPEYGAGYRDSDGDGIPDYRDNYDNRRRHGGYEDRDRYRDRDDEGYRRRGSDIDPYYNRRRGGDRYDD